MDNLPEESRWRIDIRSEFHALIHASRSLDRQTISVLIFAAVAIILQMQFGSRGFFRNQLAESLSVDKSGLASWAWWFSFQGIIGFVFPVLILRFGFKNKFSDMGLGVGDWRFAGTAAAFYIPLVLIGTWILSDGAEFQSQYPHFSPAAIDWRLFVAYEALFLFYWIGWEYLWRGFILFGTARVFGLYAILVQTLPFALLHYEKPLPEALLSILGGLALGALVWRARSFWIAVPIHAFQMLSLDLFSSLRIRTGVSGIGLDSVIGILRSLFSG